MKITDIKTAQARFHYIRVYTDEGVYGTGECSHVDQGWRGTVDSMKPMLIGRDPLDVDALFERVRRAYIFRGGMAGLGISVLSGIEVALWDLAGKALGAPTYRLLGGAARDKVLLYRHAYGQTPQELVERAQGLLAEGGGCCGSARWTGPATVSKPVRRSGARASTWRPCGRRWARTWRSSSRRTPG